MKKEQIDILKKFNDLLNHIDQCSKDETSEIKSLYGRLSIDEQEEIIKILYESLEGLSREQFTVLSFFVDNNKSPALLDKMADSAIQADFSAQTYYMILIQFRYVNFILPMAGDSYIDKLYHHIYNRFVEEIKPCWSYRYYRERRPNKVVILTDQLLGERHSPTQVTMNQLYYLQKAGYEVEILIVNEKDIKVDSSVWLSGWIQMNNADIKEEEFCHELFGINVKGYNVSLVSGNIIEGMRKAIDWLYATNPEFVISIGGTSIVGDIASTFTTVICKTLSKNVPITESRYCMYEDTIDMKIGEIHNAGNMIPLRCNYQNVLGPKETGDEDKIRRLSGIDKLKVMIVGNRLDDEIDDAFIAFIEEQIRLFDNMVFVFVGDCKRLKNIMLSKGYEDKTEFVGYIDNLSGVTGACDLFLNPPRAGGGYSSKIALKKGVPIITLGDCDVYYWAGDRFLCNDLDDMADTLKRYYEDIDFRKMKIEECRERCLELELSEEEGISNTKLFCDEIREYILKDKEERNV